MVAPRALVFRPLVKGNEALGTRLEPIRFANLDSEHAQSDGKSVNRGLPVLDLARGPQRSNECACLRRARARGNGLHHFHRNKQRQNGGRFKFRGIA